MLSCVSCCQVSAFSKVYNDLVPVIGMGYDIFCVSMCITDRVLPSLMECIVRLVFAVILFKAWFGILTLVQFCR